MGPKRIELLGRFKDIWRLVGNSESDSGAWAEFGQTENGGRIELHARGFNLRSDSQL